MSETTICTPYDGAVDAVKRGWAVIPVHALNPNVPDQCTCGKPDCANPGKHPVEGEWQRSAYISMPDCYTLWKEMYPEYNAGILPGAKSGVFLADIDPRNGGAEQLAALEAKYGALPETYGVRTGSNGNHFYFALPPGMTVNSGKLRDENGKKLDGIDILSNGRMAVLPGSVSGSGPYFVMPDRVDKPILPPPAWLLSLLPPDASEFSGEIVMAADLPSRLELPTHLQERYYHYAISVIEKECDAYATAPWGQGNDRLFLACCNILEILQSPWSGVTLQYAQNRLEAARSKRWQAAEAAARAEGRENKNGATRSEVQATWNSAQRRVRGKGRKLPGGDDSRWDGLLLSAPLITGSAATSGSAITGSPFMQPSDAEAAALDELEGGGVQITEADRIQFAQAEAQAKWEAAVREEVARQEVRKAAEEFRKTGALPGAGITEDAVEALLGKMLTPGDLDELPNPTPLIVDVLDMDSESWIIGSPGGFKSFVALDWAGHVGRGLDWRGKRTTQGNVIYVVAEGAKGIKLRKKAWEEAYGSMRNVYFLPEPVQVSDHTAWAVLVEACRRLEPVFIVLDTQARITLELNENTSEMGVLIEAVRKLKVATGACILVVHHTAKGGTDARGHSSINGAQDSRIRVIRPENNERRLLKAEIVMDKQKDSSEDEAFKIEMQEHDWGRDPVTGRRLSSLSIKPLPPFSQPNDIRPLEVEERTTEAQTLILEVLRLFADPDDGASPADIRKWIKEYCDQKGIPQVKPGTVDGNLPRLKERNLIIKEGSKYRLP